MRSAPTSPSTRPTDSPLAVVTGASSGIGREIAIRLAERGYRTVLIARRAHLLEQLAHQLEQHAPSVPFVLDLARTGEIASAAESITASHGPAHVLVNNAGAGMYRPFLDADPDEFQRLMRVNFDAVVLLTRALLPGLMRNGNGRAKSHVFNVCSMSARIGAWGHSAYAAAKGAMRSFTEALNAEHHDDGVRFTAVYPGIIATEYFSKGDMRDLWPKVKHHAVPPRRVADAVVRSIGRDRPAIYVPGHLRLLDCITAISHRAAQRVVHWGSGAP